MVLYMAVTYDKFEMPLYVTDSRKEIARYLGVSPDAVSCLCARNNRKPPINRTVPQRVRVRRVVIDEMEDEEFDET